MADLQIRYPVGIEPPGEPRPVMEDVSLVIPTVGRDILESCLAYVVRGTRWPACVIVVDQGRRTEVVGMMEQLRAIGLGCEYLPSSQRGKSAGLNRGLERVRTRFVAIADDDCFVSKDWLERMVLRLRRMPDQIVTGRVALAGNEEAPFSIVSGTAPRLYTRPTARVHPFSGGNVGMAMSIVERIWTVRRASLPRGRGRRYRLRSSGPATGHSHCLRSRHRAVSLPVGRSQERRADRDYGARGRILRNPFASRRLHCAPAGREGSRPQPDSLDTRPLRAIAS